MTTAREFLLHSIGTSIRQRATLRPRTMRPHRHIQPPCVSRIDSHALHESQGGPPNAQRPPE